ncbi:14915_t:CDS:2 [Funneliformis geosporum]|uniref:14915_t:CDS:1 n=1 Tax=Funneliformis geosporum TaxID=1117311 RepID=A0A9W4SVT8_9GLOM|nr:14915_t:CDS:2 [Funneliformis geosporum]
MNLEQNPTNSNSRQELDSKKQQLKVLETKAKELIKPLPLDTQITILQKEIKVLTNKSTKTKAEEVLLVDKRKQLNELLGGKNNSFTTNAKSGDKTTLYIEDINFQKEEYEKKLGTIKELLKNKEKNLEETNSELQLLNQKLIILHNSRIRRIINPAKKGKINLKIADCLKTINKLNDEISEMIKEKANILGKLEANKKVVNMEEIGGLEEVLTVINEEDQQELEEVTTNAQEYINQKYPTPKDKANCRVLDISSYHWQHNSQGRKEKLTGSLSLQGFINLKQLNCSFNQISEIDVNDCHQLEMFICSHNRLTKLDCTGLDKLRIIICTSNLLTSLDHSFLNSAKLISLSISNNSFPKQDLSVFSKFTNLQYLGIGNDNEMFNNDTYNRFYGSLDPLKSLTKLDCLEINNTDVDSGLEYLSDNIQTICCHFGFRPESKVRKIAEQLSANDLFFFDGESYKKK